jgi:hypothetical protein
MFDPNCLLLTSMYNFSLQGLIASYVEALPKFRHKLLLPYPEACDWKGRVRGLGMDWLICRSSSPFCPALKLKMVTTVFAKTLEQLQHKMQLNPCKVNLYLYIKTQAPKTWRCEQYHDQHYQYLISTALETKIMGGQDTHWHLGEGGTNLAEWSPPDWSTSRQPSPGGLAAPRWRIASGSTQRLTPGSRPTRESAGCVCTSWRGDARRHCSAETVTWLVKKLLTFCGIQRFISTFTKASHWALSTADSIYYTFSQTTLYESY